MPDKIQSADAISHQGLSELNTTPASTTQPARPIVLIPVLLLGIIIMFFYLPSRVVLS